MYYNKYRNKINIETSSYADAVKRKNAIKNFFQSGFRNIPGVINGQLKEKSLLLNVNFEMFQAFYNELYDRITNLTENISINTLESAYLKRNVSNIVINIMTADKVIIKDYTIDIDNFILYSTDKNKFDTIVRVEADAARNEDVTSFVQACTLLYSSIESINHISDMINSVVCDLKDVSKDCIINKSLNSFYELLETEVDEIRTYIFKALFYKSEHELSDVEKGIVDELKNIKNQFNKTLLLEEEYIENNDYTSTLSTLINEWYTNETEENN